MKKILVLYTALADYMLNSFNYYTDNYNAEFHIIHWPIRDEAPFVFSRNKSIKLYDKSKLVKSELENITKKIRPDAIICSGWVDKDYIKIVKDHKKIIPTILTMDNHWEGNLKQQLLRLASPIYLKNIFSHIWVPGKPQKRYAKKLSFRENQILTGYYVANEKVFASINYEPENTFVYLGRYINHKGINDLWTAFIELKKEYPNNWNLKCMGTGDLWDKRVIHEDIEHLGFVQPSKISKSIKGGVFILPSHFEPWGVVVHEFAMAGFPMIISDKVGAGTEFLNKNGYLFSSGNVKDLKKQMKLFMKATSDDIRKFGIQSKLNSKLISNKSWSEQLNNVLTNYK
jgi:glycosyltransferase involved in cell wall biosynthesis